MKKFALVLIPLAAALAVMAYVFLAGGPDTPSETAQAPEWEGSGRLPSAEPPGGDAPNSGVMAAPERRASATPTADERPPKRESETEGDLTMFSMTHGEIGYVDVDSVLQDRNPYSVLALLKEHQELTGADESLEIEIVSAGENEVWGHEATFEQLIGEQPTGKIGKVFFSSSGAVARMTGDILNTQALSPATMVVLSAEAEAIAREAAVDYAKTLPVLPEWRGKIPWDYEAYPAKLVYELDAENKLVRLWRVGVSIYGPVEGGAARIWISPETGEVVDVTSGVSYASSNGPTFRVCKGDARVTGRRACDKKNATLVISGGVCQHATLCEEPRYKVPYETAKNVISQVQGISSDHIAGMGNAGIDIVVGPISGAHGYWNEDERRIKVHDSLSGQDDYKRVAAHEVFHALSQSPEQHDVEHGLVYAMTAIYMGADDEQWEYEGVSITDKNSTFGGRVGQITTNAIYRVFEKIGKDKAFEFALRIDRRRPSDLAALERAMKQVAEDMSIESKVTAVLLEKEAMEAGLSQGGIEWVWEQAEETAEKEGNATEQRIFEIFNEKMEFLIEALRSVPDEFDSPDYPDDQNPLPTPPPIGD